MPSKSPHSRNVHVWKSTTAEGEKREVRAEKFGGRWKLQAKIEGEEAWTYYPSPSLEDLADLRDVLWRKYQRKKLPYEDLTTIERMITESGGKVEPLR